VIFGHFLATFFYRLLKPFRPPRSVEVELKKKEINKKTQATRIYNKNLKKARENAVAESEVPPLPELPAPTSTVPTFLLAKSASAEYIIDKPAPTFVWAPCVGDLPITCKDRPLFCSDKPQQKYHKTLVTMGQQLPSGSKSKSPGVAPPTVTWLCENRRVDKVPVKLLRNLLYNSTFNIRPPLSMIASCCWRQFTGDPHL
jgi:hypothetical protein